MASTNEEITLDRLSGSWRIYQLRGGHRFSTDDVLTAWTALAARPEARQVLDLGAGVGSVGLITLHGLSPEAHLVSVEVQEVSAGLARRTVAHNGLLQRVDVRTGDLRDASILEEEERFDIIVANPPYLPEGSATRSPHPQRAAARLELHGDVFDYCRTAARHLAPTGRFCFSHAARDPRPARAITDAGLNLLGRREVFFRQGRPASLALYTCGREDACEDPPPLIIRDLDGVWTDAYLEVRLRMGLHT
jgi:tRNA1Val (adenine37-N6)-methyltransferase